MKTHFKIAMLVGVIISLIGIILWQAFYSQAVNYYIISVSILFLSMFVFFVSFEHKKITAREVTLVATLIALAVVSRVAFYLVPQVKPIAAVVIVSAVCLGAERGFIVGAFSAFISNFVFGQGYWTPFQMVALGLVGFIAGMLFKVIKANRWTLAVVGFLLAFVVYGLIVDASTILIMYGDNLTLKGALAVYGAGVSFSAVFGVSTAIFLFLFG
jgi:energy-coupling factor transport system substrate-specific component